MSTALRWNASGSRVMPVQLAPKWREVRQGLTLTASGYLVLLLGAVPGLLLVGLARRAERLGWLPAGLEQEDAELAGVVLAAAAGSLGYLLLLAGQWRCLTYAPQRHGAKEWMLIGILCLLVGAFSLIAAQFLGGSRNYAALWRGPDALDDLKLLEGGGLLQLMGLSLLLLSCLMFGQFLRITCGCLQEGASTAGMDSWFFCVFLLLGGSVGGALLCRGWTRPLVLQGIVLGWALAWLWHLALLLITRRCIRQTLRRLGAGTRQVPRLRYDEMGRPKPPSGLQHAPKRVGL
jgi:hypothetical protein